jgi:hypothetical protein
MVRNARTTARIFAILARGAPVGVILRRGPSKQILLLKWHLRSDTLEPGQWFKGRIYERRCDLSPSGDLFIYFAAKHRPPYGTWTAISRPPWFTALALWPKGDAWGGGGMFESELAVALNHGSAELAEDFQLKRRMRTTLFGQCPGWGEDWPIYEALLASRGWALIDRPAYPKPNWRDAVVWRYKQPIVYEHVGTKHRRLRMSIRGINQKNDAWYWIDYAVLDRAGATLLDLPRTDWADWDRGDLVYAREGKLFRVPQKSFEAGAPQPKLIADLGSMTFAGHKAPAAATRWP